MFLARRGEVGCLPHDVFVVTDALYEVTCAYYAQQSKARAHEVRVFRLMQEAARWIDGDPDEGRATRPEISKE